MTEPEPDLEAVSDFWERRFDEAVQGDIDENEAKETWEYGATEKQANESPTGQSK